MTNKQLAEVLADYAGALPNWHTNGKETLYRDHFPVRQKIWFQKMASGGYRPTHSISALPLPVIRMLHQIPDVKHVITKYTQHKDRWPSVLASIEQLFRPAVLLPISISEIEALCKLEARPATNDLAMLAVLSVVLERTEEAKQYCLSMQDMAPPIIAPVLEMEEEIKAFGRDLLAAVEADMG